MKPFKIICDSACDLPKDLVAKYDIDVVSFYVSLDDQNYYKEQEKNTQGKIRVSARIFSFPPDERGRSGRAKKQASAEKRFAAVYLRACKIN